VYDTSFWKFSRVGSWNKETSEENNNNNNFMLITSPDCSTSTCLFSGNGLVIMVGGVGGDFSQIRIYAFVVTTGYGACTAAGGPSYCGPLHALNGHSL